MRISRVESALALAIVLFAFDPTTVPAGRVFTLDAGNRLGSFAPPVARDFDFNRNGSPDPAVGAPGHSSPNLFTGRVCACLREPDPDAIAGVVISGSIVQDRPGECALPQRLQSMRLDT